MVSGPMMADERATAEGAEATEDSPARATLRPMIVRAARVLIGTGSRDDGVETRRRAILTMVVCYAAMVLSFVFASLAMVQGRWTLATIEVGLAVLLGGIGAFIRLVGYHPAPNYVAGATSGAFFVYLLATGGAGGSGHIWTLTFPLFALFIWGANRRALASLALLAVIGAYFVFEDELAVAAAYPWAFKARFLAGYVLVLSFTYFFECTRATSQKQLADQNVDLERKVAELQVTDEARRESETLLKATFESTGDGILVVSAEGKVMAVNDEFAEMWRLPAKVIASGEAEQIRAHVVDQLVDPAGFNARVDDLYQSGEAQTDSLHFKDERVFERRSAPLVVNGTVVGRVWSFRDTSNQLRAEREQTRLQAELQRSQKMEALGQLAAGVAHDLNNVLAAVVGYPDLLLRKLPADSPLRDDLLTIRASGTNAALIVQDLLTLARRGVSNRSILNLNSVVESYLNSPEHLDLLSFHPTAEVKSSLAEGLLNMSGSAIHLNKTLMNLVSNAAEAIAEGGEIQITTSNRYVDTPVVGYDSVQEGEYVLLSVQDNGGGIAPDDLEHIFEPFYTKKQMGRSGSGLGLAVVWSTVKDLDGYIDVRSSAEEGTGFTLYFPATRANEELEPRASQRPPRGKGETVLVVDDMPEQRDVTDRMLRSLGYQVTTVASGEEAVDYLQDHEADLLVLDMIMSPGIDGLETYRRILEDHPGQRAILASGYAETERVRQAQRLGAGQYLKKPYLLDKLALAVKQALEAPQGG